MSNRLQTRYSGFIYKRYGIMLCLLFSSLSAAASTLETGNCSGIALIDTAWHTLIEFQRQFTTRFIESGGVAVARFRTLSNTVGALLVTMIGTVSFFAFLGMR